MTIWFTADHHFGHKRILEYANRPFPSVKRMDEMLIDNWNDVVRDDDIIYHLGDFTLGGIDGFVKRIERLNGIIQIVPGGHDRRWVKQLKSPLYANENFYSKSERLVVILDPIVSLEFPELSGIKYPHIVVLCHYAMRTWDRSHYGAYQLYGHSHGRLSAFGRTMDVGVDTNNFYPYSLEEVHQKLKNIPIGGEK